MSMYDMFEGAFVSMTWGYWIQRLQRKFKNSYARCSPQGEGLVLLNVNNEFHATNRPRDDVQIRGVEYLPLTLGFPLFQAFNNRETFFSRKLWDQKQRSSAFRSGSGSCRKVEKT